MTAGKSVALIPSQNTLELTEMTFIVEMNYHGINCAESKLRVEIENMGKNKTNKTRFGLGFPCQSSTMCSHRVLCWPQSKHSGGSVPPSFSLLLQIWGSTIILSWCSFLLNCKHRQSAGAFSRHYRDCRCPSEAQWHSWTCLNTQPCSFLCIQHLNIQFDGFVGRVLKCINACKCISAEAADCFFVLN